MDNKQRILDVLEYYRGRASQPSVIYKANIKDNVVGIGAGTASRKEWSARKAIDDLVEDGLIEKIRTRWGFSIRLRQTS